MTNFLWSNFSRQTTSEVEIITSYWQQTPLFKNIPKRHVADLAEKMHLRTYQQDEWVFRSGDQGAGAIMVLDGAIRISARQTTLAELATGDFFGEIALAENDKRTADALCLKPCRLAFFLKQDLEEWIDIEPRLGNVFLLNLASTLAQRLHIANQLLAQLNLNES